MRSGARTPLRALTYVGSVLICVRLGKAPSCRGRAARVDGRARFAAAEPLSAAPPQAMISLSPKYVSLSRTAPRSLLPCA